MPRNLFGRILVVVDGAEPSVAAGNYAVQLAAQCGGELTAIHVVDTATMDYLSHMRILVSEERLEFERDLATSGQRYLEYVRTVGRASGLDVRTVQGKGNLHQTVLKEAETLAVDVIVVGGWSASVLQKDFSSVERQLLMSEARCPVIVVKAK
ncbi:MAG: Universal stress protein family protein [Lentisphaerae bacterium ADurb.BinA184]|nr:MAG: Universal stress protein family protein [Lentisphaerae bacterium ADurb.BinA184]